MKQADLDRFRLLAAKATPGRRFRKPHGVVTGGLERQFARGSGRDQLALFMGSESVSPAGAEANADLDAAMYPEAVVRMVNEIEAVRDRLDRAKRLAQEAREWIQAADSLSASEAIEELIQVTRWRGVIPEDVRPLRRELEGRIEAVLDLGASPTPEDAVLLARDCRKLLILLGEAQGRLDRFEAAWKRDRELLSQIPAKPEDSG